MHWKQDDKFRHECCWDPTWGVCPAHDALTPEEVTLLKDLLYVVWHPENRHLVRQYANAKLMEKLQYKLDVYITLLT